MHAFPSFLFSTLKYKNGCTLWGERNANNQVNEGGERMDQMRRVTWCQSYHMVDLTMSCGLLKINGSLSSRLNPSSLGPKKT